MINGGIYFGTRDFFEKIAIKGKYSLEKEILEKKYNKCHFYGVAFDDYFLDIGIPKDYNRAQNEFKRFSY